MPEPAAEVVVVGVGADGWAGLPETSRAPVRAATLLFGSARQLALLPGPPEVPGRRSVWPTPLLPALPELFAATGDERVCVIASGDPLLYGIGARLVRLLGPDRVRVLPHASSVSLACAKLGWPVERTVVCSAVGRPVAAVRAALAPGRRLLVLSADASTPASVASLVTESGYGAAELTVLQQLGGPAERVWSGPAGGGVPATLDPLNILAIQCPDRAEAPVPWQRTGLPDEAYAHDGQLTKQEVRALALARLAPAPGELLWDVGAGAGSIGIEWMRTDPACRAVAVERRADRAERAAANATALGVPDLRVVTADAPAALVGLPVPDAVFIGGGLTVEGVLPACWSALRPGGRLVATAVTVESEALLGQWHARVGGELSRIAVSRAGPLGSFTGWRALAPVTLWSARRPVDGEDEAVRT